MSNKINVANNYFYLFCPIFLPFLGFYFMSMVSYDFIRNILKVDKTLSTLCPKFFNVQKKFFCSYNYLYNNILV